MSNSNAAVSPQHYPQILLGDSHIQGHGASLSLGSSPNDATAALPNETLMHIFSFHCGPYPVASVSRRWRQVALACRNLWEPAEYVLPQARRFRGVDLFAEWQGRPLSISAFGGDSPMNEADVDCIAKHLPHIHSLSLELQWLHIGGGEHLALSKLIRPAPLLQCLNIRNASDLQSWPAGLLGDYAPRLQELTLSQLSGIPWASPMFSGLVALKVDLPICEEGPEHCETILDALANMRSLKALSLGGSLPISHATAVHGARSIIPLTQLRVLAMTDDVPESCLHILMHLDVPPTASLKFCMGGKDSSPAAFVPVLPVISRYVANWARTAYSQKYLYLKCDRTHVKCIIDRDFYPEWRYGHTQDHLRLEFRCDPKLDGGISELTRLAWKTISWGSLKHIVLDDIPQDESGLPESWWDILKTARSVRELWVWGSLQSAEVVIKFLTAQDVSLQRGKRDTFFPALEELDLGGRKFSAWHDRLPAEMEAALRVWANDRQEIGCPVRIRAFDVYIGNWTGNTMLD